MNERVDVKDIASAYDSPPWWYDIRGFLILKCTYRSSLIKQLMLFSKNMRAKHLEVAVGSGSLLGLILFVRWLFKKPSCEIFGFDYAPAMLAGAVHKFHSHQNIHLALGNVEELTYEPMAFDSINVANAIHCFAHPDRALSELYRVLKPGGQLAVNALLEPRRDDPLKPLADRINAWGTKKGILNRAFEPSEFIGLVQAANFQIIKQEFHGNTLNLVATRPI